MSGEIYADIEKFFTLIKEGNGDPKQYASHHEACDEHAGNHVWAVVGGDDDDDDEPVFSVLPGWHLVNVLYYVATVEPWHEEDPVSYTY